MDMDMDMDMEEAAAESTRLDDPEPTSDQEIEDAADRSEGAADRSEGAADRSEGAADRSEGAADRSEGAADRSEGAADRSEGAADRSEGAADHSQIVRPYCSEDEDEIDMGSFAIPDVHEESSLVDEEPTHVEIGEARPILFQIVQSGSQKRGLKLHDSRGFSYNVKNRGKETVMWQCVSRNKGKYCPATVKQKGEDYTLGARQHNHQATMGIHAVTTIRNQVKALAKVNVYTSGTSIAQDLLRTGDIANCPADIPTIINLGRQANYNRRIGRPKHPGDMHFNLNMDHVPDNFFLADVGVGRGENYRRHLMFATQDMLTLLSSAKRWYMDATFKLVRAPFTQLWSIHAFLRYDGNIKQVPLLFVMMTGKRAKDYQRVLEVLLEHLPTQPKLRQGVLDFEAAVWNAMRTVFPTVELLGCAFHWNQAIYRKVQDIGLSPAYHEKKAIFKYVRQLMALVYLPHEHITRIFEDLRQRTEEQGLRQLTTYIAQTWIQSDVWPTRSWSVFMQSVRTNNDVEGWHNRLNAKVKGRSRLNMYQLINLLNAEAKDVDLQKRLLTDGHVMRHQRTTYKNIQRRLFRLWEEFNDGHRSAQQLLKASALFMGPAPLHPAEPAE